MIKIIRQNILFLTSVSLLTHYLLLGGHSAVAGLFVILLLPIALDLDLPGQMQYQGWSSINKLRTVITPALLIIAYLICVKVVLNGSWLSISAIIALDFQSLSSLFFAVVGIYGIHLVNYKVLKSLGRENKRERLYFYAATTIMICLASLDNLKAGFIGILVGSIYFLLLDLFSEEGQSSIVWSIVWNIIIGSFLTLSIFHLDQSLDISTRQISLLNAFSLFSIIFILTGFFLIAMAIVNRKNAFLPLEWDFNFSNSRQLRNRIQLAILVTLLFSFVGIGLVSVYHIQLSGNLNSAFVQALLNTYVFLFLIGFAISISLAEYIRNPLIQLGKTLKAVKLNKDNEKILWEGNDEIGNLIAEYNHMIDQLRENAVLLAQTERDNAWREMAKQVAHEIKNPLTPMKLSLQHLEKTIKSQKSNTEAITLRMCETLMNQVENLKQIADEFSNFGSLPKANNEKILLNDIVETIHDLFRKRGDMNINLIEPIDDIGVYADKNHLLRVLNNLVKNSIQSIPEDRKGDIELKLWKEGNKAFIRVRDNGTGIPDKMRNQIFKPKFTTKTSGSGLGLAISANMIDAIGGRIYFESTVNHGTDFFVELPLIRSKFSENRIRVSLDEQ